MKTKTFERKRVRNKQFAIAVNILQTLILIVPVALNIIGPETSWLGTLNMYLPQWIWGIPLLITLPLTFILYRKLFWLPMLSILWVVGPVMGLVINFPQSALNSSDVIRIMTYNVKGGRRDANAVAADIRKYHPDVILMDDQQGVLRTVVGTVLSGWHISDDPQFVVATRLPVLSYNGLESSHDTGEPYVSDLRILFHHQRITFLPVHLMTPRFGIKAIAKRGKLGEMEAYAQYRLIQADTICGDLSLDRGPIVVAGDFNSTVSSLVIRKLLNKGFEDAFSVAGNGYGYTYGQYTPLHYPFMRIDHILINKDWKVVDCFTGNSIGSDHSPVIADLELKHP